MSEKDISKNNNDESKVDVRNSTFKSCKDVDVRNSTFRSCKDVTFVLPAQLSSVACEYDQVNLSGDKESLSVLEPETVEGGERGMWTNQVEFFLSCMAYAVGIGNVWRFPYKCFKNGGGVFLIPYLIMLALAALPMFYMELALGQFYQLGPNKVFGKLAPAFRGLGYGMLCVTMWVAIYYNVIIAWAFFYTFASLTSHLDWADCGNWFNTPDCFLPEMAKQCDEDSTWWNNTCTSISLYCKARGVEGAINSTHCLGSTVVETLHQRVSPAEEYFKRYMLLMDDNTSLDHMGGVNWRLAGCLLLSWVVVMACLIKGVKSAGKVVWFTALFPYLVLVLLLVRGVTLPGAMEGIKYFLYPDWHKLLSVHVWTDAATQIFYSLGPAFGGLITLASYNRRDNNCQRDAVLIALANSGTSIFAGFVIFSILGFMAQELNVPVAEVVEGGIGLAFVVYPTAVTKLPVSPLWSFLFFTMLLTLGLDSQFTMVESLITALYDEKPSLRKNQWEIVGGVCLVGFLLGLPMCLQGGFYLFVLLDWYAGSWSLLVLAVTEVVLVGWVYGTERFSRDIYNMGIRTSRYLSCYWVFTWKVSTPLLLSCVLVATLLDYQPAKEGDYMFPDWANGLGWGVAISSLVVVLPLSCKEIWSGVLSGLPLSTMFTPCRLLRDTATNQAIKASSRNLDYVKHEKDNIEADQN
eukprot:GFUD01004741.1.p1 GENE.GFUD01004741.1~~GFUD01004741.1.p1  ORF type:complete len:691 (-),score=179.44 GFUD01004741.1:18-2090(-)